MPAVLQATYTTHMQNLDCASRHVELRGVAGEWQGVAESYGGEAAVLLG